MPKILIIAEKPAMGRDIADAIAHTLGKTVSRDGLAQTVGDYTIIGAQGHLFALSDAEKYGTQFAFPWKVEVLPVLPEQFTIEPNFEKNKGSVVNTDLTKSIRDRLTKIKTLIKDASEVIHAGDPDREGQLIIDDVLREFKFKGPVKRLWLHAQTRDGIQDALRKMKNNKDYENLGLAALARRESDWAIGINATRAYSALWWKKGNKGVLNIGRVVTPVVGMVVQREKDISAFIPVDHYTLKATVQISGQDAFDAAWVKPTGEPPDFDITGKLVVSKPLVYAVQKKCAGKEAKISVAEKKPKKESPPILFSLTDLQKMAAKMGHSPDDVLKAAQSLYEKHKLTSYPRSDCQYAPESERLKAGKVIDAILKNFGATWQIPAGYDVKQKSKSWDDSKLAEHYAIIPLPTSVPAANLSPIERDVYKLICRQYLAQFYPDYEYMATTIVATVSGEKFKATGSVPTKDGWRVLYGGGKALAQQKSGDDEAQEKLPNVQVGDSGIAEPVTLVAKETEPPKRFTAITLLEAMEKAYLFVTDPQVKATLKEVEGLGTAATRASIIAKMVSAGFASESKSGKVIAYAPTEKALVYIDSVPDTLAKPDLTAWFEGRLEELAKGSLAYAKYRELLEKLVHKAIESAKDGSALGRMQKVEATTPAASKPTKKPAAKRSAKKK